MAGHRYGRLTCLRQVERRGAKGQIYWLCVCDCGNEHEAQGGLLRCGHITSCGCLRKEAVASGLNRKHGESKSPVYEVWSEMISRCHNPRHKNFRYYGGRGIYVCPEWRHSYESFAAAMGPRPAGMTVERIDNDGPYAPSNCKWATRVEQSRNTRRGRRITVDGESRKVREWAELKGWAKDLIYGRIANGWSERDAITVTPRYLKREK